MILARFHFLFRLAIFVLTLSLFTSLALAATPVLLIGPDLKPRLVNLQAMGGGRMTYFDDQRNMQVQSTSDVLQVRFPKESDTTKSAGFIDAPELELTQTRTTVEVPEKGTLLLGGSRLIPGPPLAFIELISGQRIVAVYTGAKADGQTLLFKHDLLGELAIALDQVSRLSFARLSNEGAMVSSATPTSDQVEMTNGDVVTGFVISIKDAGIEVQQGDAKPFTLPRDRVKAIRLANPVTRAAGKQSMVWLRDGSRIASSDVSISADKLTLDSSLAALKEKQTMAIDLKQIARIELASPAGQLIDLADLPMTVTEGGKVFGVTMEPRIEGDAIRLHAPITVSFSLPAKAARFAAVAQLDVENENPSLAHFIITIDTTSLTAARHVITAKTPRADINAALTGNTLTITLDPARNGPVLDRLRLTDAVIFVER